MKFSIWLESQFNDDIEKALLNLKYTAPDLDMSRFDDLISKLNDRGLIPAGVNPARFAAALKSRIKNPPLDKIDKTGERIPPEHWDAVELSKRRYWGAFKKR